MEFPHLGNHCSDKSCNKLDFLPIKCDACGQIFCNEHFAYTTHNCPESYKKNNQVPVCPLCSKPVPSRGQLPDAAVSRHIDNDCQSDRAINHRKIFTNRCSRKGCKVKEYMRVICEDCGSNFCLRHRNPLDHECRGKMAKHMPSVISQQSYQAQKLRAVQGTMSEDEALARALQLSMQESSNSQEDRDLRLARQLQAMERRNDADSDTRKNNNCSLS